MKNILLPTDFSENSLNAIDYALEFFKGTSCNFYILNVQKSSDFLTADLVTAAPEASVYEAIASDNKKQLMDLIRTYKLQFAHENYSLKPIFDYDNLVNAINETLAAHKVDLIIMGTNGATNAREILFGSNTIRVIRNIKCPLLVIPEDYKFSQIENVLFSTFRSEDFSSAGIKILKEIIKRYQPEVSVIELNNNPITSTHKKDDARVKRLLKDINYKFSIVNRIPAAMAISTVTQFLNIDLHAMFLDEEENFLERFIFGSERTKMSYATSVPLLILHK
ncbi:nucleotide-binding universal stress UspA family protein [Gillisia mitskevichiae]|uniref:Nucleotide-binding universal stress UspA family protein n=1 Tax=Gillisia mitskevichiae TaxID=270921 RepID=A0A495PVX0_9FLAO|nr:universal stress protein [Gillisia mitskevichiae]RKS53692.1 nucleotide-binding universal stress UspA family protein [Gillisia mitskevichiae]